MLPPLLTNPFAFTSSCFFFSFCVSLSQTQHHQHQQHRRHYQPQCHSISLPGILKSFVFSLCASRCVLLILFCFSSVGFLGSGVSRVSSSTASGICINICICIYIHICICFAAAASELQHHSFSITASASELQHQRSEVQHQQYHPHQTQTQQHQHNCPFAAPPSSLMFHVSHYSRMLYMLYISLYIHTHIQYTLTAYFSTGKLAYGSYVVSIAGLPWNVRVFMRFYVFLIAPCVFMF